MSKIKISLAQVTSGRQVDANLKKIEEFAKAAKKDGAHILALPENFGYFGNEQEKLSERETISTEIEKALFQFAKSHSLFILGGGYPTVDEKSNRVFNTATCFSPDGTKIFTYRKIHLFDSNPGDGTVYQESNSTSKGMEMPSIFSIPEKESFRFSSVICYDVRFGELFRELTLVKRANAIFVPAAFAEVTGKAHWEVLLRARAIENQIYILAPGQWGEHSAKRKTFGHSVAINPWGEIIQMKPDGEGIFTVELDMEFLNQVRKKLPAIQHVRIKMEFRDPMDLEFYI